MEIRNTSFEKKQGTKKGKNSHLIFCLIARRVIVRIKLIFRRDGLETKGKSNPRQLGCCNTYMPRNETRQRPNFCEEANFVHLSNHSIKHFAFERSENDGFVFNRIQHKSSSRLNDASSYVVDGCDSNNESIPERKSDINLTIVQQ